MRAIVAAILCSGTVLSLFADIPGATVTPLNLSGSGHPTRLATGPDGNAWFIDEGGKVVGKMTISGSTATLTTYPITLPPGQAVLNWARAIAGGSDAVWFVVQGCTTGSCANSTTDLGRITQDGTMSLIPITGSNDTTSGMVVGPDGNVWYTADGAVVRVTPQGSATRYASPSGSCCGTGIVVGPDQAIWFAEGGMIGRVTTAGSLTEFPVAGADVIANGPDGNLWFANQGSPDQLGRLTPSGQQTLYKLPEKAYIGGLTAGPDGNIWFTEHFDPKIGQFVISSGTANIQAFNGTGQGGDIVPVNLTSPSSMLRIAPLDFFKGFIATFKPLTGLGDVVKITTTSAPTAAPDLTVTKSHIYDPDAIPPNRTVWKIRVCNIGNALTTGPWQVTDALPSGFRLEQSSLPSGCVVDVSGPTNVLRCTRNDVLDVLDPFADVPDLNSCTEIWVFGQMDVADGTVVSNQATVSGGGETNTTNDMSNVDTFTVGNPTVEVTKASSGDRFLGTFQWAIRVKNTSTIPTSGPLTITDNLPVGVTLQPFGDLLGAKCSVSGSRVTCTTDDALQPGKSITIPLPVASMPNDAVQNTATVTGGGIDPTTSQPSSSAQRASQPSTTPAPQITNGRHP